MTAEGGDSLQYVILKVKVETRVESRLSAVVQSLEPGAGRFSQRISFGHRGLVSLDSLLVGETDDSLDSLEKENNMVALGSCLCINPQIQGVPGCRRKVCQSSSKSPVILQNCSSPVSNKRFPLLSFPRKPERTHVTCRYVCWSLWRAFRYSCRVFPSSSEVLIWVPSNSKLLPVFSGIFFNSPI